MVRWFEFKFYINLNKWYFVSTTHDSSNSKLYINGILDKASALNKSKGTNGFTTSIGAKNDGMIYVPPLSLGLIDDLQRIYSRTLSDSEILKLYELSNTAVPIKILDANVSTISSRGDFAYFF